jgi:XTP/dITP diphosphohydrolase
VKIVLATGNQNKVREIQPLLPESWEVVSLKDLEFEDELQEDHDNIEDNSLQKARFIWKKYQLPCIAEDTGLFVQALNGAPGVNTAHYAGPERSNQDNIGLLLKNMEGKENRSAYFKTVMTLILNDIAYQFEGKLEGNIALQSFGEGGFGYDPVFEIKKGVTLAMIPKEEKQLISHRGKALLKLLDFLNKTENDSGMLT